MVILIILSILLWIGAFAATFKRILLSPALSYLALFALSFAKKDGFPLLPINSTILWGWLTMTLIVMAATVLQPPTINKSSKGEAYILAGAIVGMVIGLLGFTMTYDISLLYGIMVVCTAAGTALGFLLFTGTPSGRGLSPSTGMFLRYLIAKGFPTAITVMQLGVALVIAIALHNIGSL